MHTLPAKKLHCRARTSALYFSQTIPTTHAYTVLFASSVLNLAELLGVRPDLHQCRKIVYFHDNQLVCPVRDVKDRDCQFGLNQIMTWSVCTTAVIVALSHRRSHLPTAYSRHNSTVSPPTCCSSTRTTIAPRS